MPKQAPPCQFYWHLFQFSYLSSTISRNYMFMFREISFSHHLHQFSPTVLLFCERNIFVHKKKRMELGNAFILYLIFFVCESTKKSGDKKSELRVVVIKTAS